MATHFTVADDGRPERRNSCRTGSSGIPPSRAGPERIRLGAIRTVQRRQQEWSSLTRPWHRQFAAGGHLNRSICGLDHSLGRHLPRIDGLAAAGGNNPREADERSRHRNGNVCRSVDGGLTRAARLTDQGRDEPFRGGGVCIGQKQRWFDQVRPRGRRTGRRHHGPHPPGRRSASPVGPRRGQRQPGRPRSEP